MSEPTLIKHFVHLYVHTDNGAIYDLQLGALEEVHKGGTYVTRDSGQALGLADLVNKNAVSAVRLVGAQYVVFAIEGLEVVHMKLRLSADASPLTLAANYGTKVTIAPYGPHADRVSGFKFTVTPPPPTLGEEQPACA